MEHVDVIEFLAYTVLAEFSKDEDSINILIQFVNEPKYLTEYMDTDQSIVLQHVSQKMRLWFITEEQILEHIALITRGKIPSAAHRISDLRRGIEWRNDRIIVSGKHYGINLENQLDDGTSIIHPIRFLGLYDHISEVAGEISVLRAQSVYFTSISNLSTIWVADDSNISGAIAH